MLVRQKQYLAITKVNTALIENNKRYHNSVFMKIMGNAVILGLIIGSSH